MAQQTSGKTCGSFYLPAEMTAEGVPGLRGTNEYAFQQLITVTSPCRKPQSVPPQCLVSPALRAVASCSHGLQPKQPLLEEVTRLQCPVC